MDTGTKQSIIIVLLVIVVALLGFVALTMFQQSHALLPDGSKPNPFSSSITITTF